MAKDTPPDPGAAFRDWVTQWERSFDSLANQFMGTEGFSQAMNEFQKSQLNAQRMLAETMTQILTNMNMPTREDVMRLGEAVQGIDRRLERIETQLSVKAANSSQAKKPPRTRKPVAKTQAEQKSEPAQTPAQTKEPAQQQSPAQKQAAAQKQAPAQNKEAKE